MKSQITMPNSSNNGIMNHSELLEILKSSSMAHDSHMIIKEEEYPIIASNASRQT
jgi:hypothetical protein